MKVVRWVKDDNTLPVSCGGMGGWVNGEKWDEYLRSRPVHERPYLEAIRESVVAGWLTLTGEEHQYADGVPVFEDGTCAGFSWRGWGDLMAAIWNTEINETFGYMAFYMSGWGGPEKVDAARRSGGE